MTESPDDHGSADDAGRRRVRRRKQAASPADMPDHAPTPEPASEKTDHHRPVTGKSYGDPAGDRTDRPEKADRVDKAERGLRGLVGAGPSQVPLSAALRARDAARPTEADLAAAEELPIVRRNYVPPDDSPL